MLKRLIVILLTLLYLPSSAIDSDYGADSLLSAANSQTVDSVKNKTLFQLAGAYFNIAVDYSMDDDRDSTLAYLFKCLDIYETIDDRKNQANTLSNIALTFSNYDMMTQTFDYLNRAMKICNQIHDTTQLARMYFILGLSNHNLNVFDISNEYFQKSKELYTYLSDTLDVEILDAAIAKNDFYIALHKSTDDMVKANIAEERAINQMVINENIIIDYLNYCHSYIEDFFATFQRLDDSRLKIYYIKTMQDFYNRALKCSDYTSWFQTQIFVSKAYISMAEGNYEAARRELSKIEDKDCAEYYEASYWYFKKVGNYKDALHFFNLKNKYENTTFKLETSARYERNQAQVQYEDKLIAFEREADRHRLVFKEQLQRSEIQHRFMVAILVLLLLIASIIIIEVYSATNLTRKLRKVNRLIMSHNSELQIVNEEVNTQTESLLDLKNQVDTHRRQLKSLNNRLMSSIRLAENIQHATIPYIDMMNRIFGECFVYWVPRDMVSGDFYWATEFGKLKYLVTADCTGHGVPGGLLSMLGISILNDIASSFQGLNAGEILDLLKDHFVSALNADSDNDDGIELSLIVMDKQNLRLQYAGAKRPLFIVRHNELLEYKPDMFFVGHNLFRNDVKFTNHTIEIREGDMIYTFSDGVTDQIGGEDGTDKFSMTALRDLLTEIADFNASQQQTIISAAIRSHIESSIVPVRQLDDQLLIGVRV